jgi:hypothetical protein
MAQPLIERILINARTIIADRCRRLRAAEAVRDEGLERDACDDHAARFCAVGALIRTTYFLTGDHEHAHRLGWKVAGLVAAAANLRRMDNDELGWSLAMLSGQRGQTAVLRAFDALIEQRRN